MLFIQLIDQVIHNLNKIKAIGLCDSKFLLLLPLLMKLKKISL